MRRFEGWAYWPTVTLEEKAEVVRHVFEELSRRETQAAAEYFDLDAIFDFTRSRGPGRGMFMGRGAIQRNWEEFLGMWAEWVTEPHDFVEVDDDGVLFSIRGRMTGRDGIELNVRASHIWTIRDGLIVRAIFFQSREEALRAAGLSDSTA
jgi:ketosteroid isomerase-like protein